MSAWKFEPEDFVCETGLARNRAAELANAKLQEWLHGAPTVYGIHDLYELAFSAQRQPGDTHTAKLVDIKPMEKSDG